MESERHLLAEKLVLRLGGKRMLLSGTRSSGLYAIGFTPSPEPLLTQTQVEAFPTAPVLVLEFDDLDAMKVLQKMVNTMIEDRTRPNWQVVKCAAFVVDMEEQ